MTSFSAFYFQTLTEARFTSIESDVTKPELTPIIQAWVNSLRKTHALKDPSFVEDFINLVHSNRKGLLLGEIQIGRKVVGVWIKDIPGNGFYIEPLKKRAEIQISMDLIIEDPSRAISTIVHELIHGMQAYRKQSDEYNVAASKSGDETEADWFYYYTEPKELEAQLGQLGHDVITLFKRSKNKQTVLDCLDYVLRLPREQFKDDSWIRQFPSLKVFQLYWNLLSNLSAPPEELNHTLRARQISDRGWRQFKQKLFNLKELLASSIKTS